MRGAGSVAEFDRRVDALVAAGHAVLTGLAEPEFRPAVAPLAELAPPVEAKSEDAIPFVLVVARVFLADAARRMTLRGGPAALMIDEDELPGNRPVAAVEIPEAIASLLLAGGGGVQGRAEPRVVS